MLALGEMCFQGMGVVRGCALELRSPMAGAPELRAGLPDAEAAAGAAPRRRAPAPGLVHVVGRRLRAGRSLRNQIFFFAKDRP